MQKKTKENNTKNGTLSFASPSESRQRILLTGRRLLLLLS